ncbi:MAG: hypothetical protein ACFE9D_10040 [Promethearchaeota archaeon]
MPRSYDRFHLIDNWFQQQTKPIRSDQIKRILKNPEIGIGSNIKETPAQDAFLTIWSWVAKLGSRGFEMATGKPVTATSRYRRYSF